MYLQVTSVNTIENHAHTHRWNSLDITRGSFGPEDFAPEIIEIKFDRVIPIKVCYIHVAFHVNWTTIPSLQK